MLQAIAWLLPRWLENYLGGVMCSLLVLKKLCSVLMHCSWWSNVLQHNGDFNALHRWQTSAFPSGEVKRHHLKHHHINCHHLKCHHLECHHFKHHHIKCHHIKCHHFKHHHVKCHHLKCHHFKHTTSSVTTSSVTTSSVTTSSIFWDFTVKNGLDCNEIWFSPFFFFVENRVTSHPIDKDACLFLFNFWINGAESLVHLKCWWLVTLKMSRTPRRYGKKLFSGQI